MAKKAKKKKVEQKKVEQGQINDDIDTNHAAAHKYRQAEMLVFERVAEVMAELLVLQEGIMLLPEQMPPLTMHPDQLNEMTKMTLGAINRGTQESTEHDESA